MAFLVKIGQLPAVSSESMKMCRFHYFVEEFYIINYNCVLHHKIQESSNFVRWRNVGIFWLQNMIIERKCVADNSNITVRIQILFKQSCNAIFINQNIIIHFLCKKIEKYYRNNIPNWKFLIFLKMVYDVFDRTEQIFFLQKINK